MADLFRAGDRYINLDHVIEVDFGRTPPWDSMRDGEPPDDTARLKLDVARRDSAPGRANFEVLWLMRKEARRLRKHLNDQSHHPTLNELNHSDPST